MRNTEVLRSLNNNELVNLEKFLRIDQKFWQSHLPKKYIHLTALKQGMSIHLQMLDDSLRDLTSLSKKEIFLDFYNILVNLCDGDRLGRAYIHKLKPNTCIEKHNDKGLLYMKHVKKRMQMYLDIPDECVLLLDNKMQPTEKFKYKYVDFAWEHDHYYYNGSDKDWVFCVFDILK